MDPQMERAIQALKDKRLKNIAQYERKESVRSQLAARQVELEREVEGRLPTGAEHAELLQLKTDIDTLVNGGTWVESPNGLSMDRDRGIKHLSERIKALDAEIAELERKAAINPDEEVRCRFKTLAVHYHEGRLLKVGEEIVLTRRQFENLNDRFELVS